MCLLSVCEGEGAGESVFVFVCVGRGGGGDEREEGRKGGREDKRLNNL